MAECNLIPGIASISGKLGKVLFKTFTRPDGTSVTRVYRTDTRTKRCSPPSERELAQRRLFGRICSEVARRQRNGDTRPKKLIWDEVTRTLQ